MDLTKRGGRKELGGVDGKKNIISLDYVEKKVCIQ